jgi:glycerol-3-phosphate O-acyltransferase
MNADVTLPLWLVAVIVVLAAWAALDRLLFPGVRWFLRRRLNRLIGKVNKRLDIELQPFKLTKREVLIDRLTFDPRVMEAVEAQSRESGVPREVLVAEVERHAREIVPAFNAYIYFSVGTWLARRVAELLYRVRLGYADDAAFAAIDPKSTVIFIMNHRSNMDYVLVGYLAATRAALSYAVGEWARIWPLQTLIRAMGAYFIRRNSGDPLYRRVLERYVAMATEAGVTQAAYPEGGLSRDGRLRPPRMGLIDYMVRSFDAEGERDVVFIPVGINYDRTLEDRSLLASLQPDAKPKNATFALRTTARFMARNFAQMAGRRWYRFGYACVNFGRPISLKGYLAEHQFDFRGLDKESRFARVEALTGTLMAAVGEVVPVLPVSLVSTVILEEPERALSELELKARAHRLIDTLEKRGAHVYVPRRDQDYALQVGLRMLTLRHLVEEDNGLYRASARERDLLRYYANAIVHLLPDDAGPSENTGS